MSRTSSANGNGTTYFFVDESGDSTFFDKPGNFIVGEKGCSPILILGFIATADPAALRQAITALHQEIATDEYLKSVPSISKSNRHFHAKDDCPEVREKVFKVLEGLDFKAEFVVARKRLDVFTKRHQRNENIFYNEIVSRLFERKLHKAHTIIYFSKRGSQTRQHHFQSSSIIANLFRRLGFTAKVTARSGDIGVDVLLKKDGKYAVVQCKRYGAEKCVGSPDIQQFVGSMQIYGAAQGFFVATTRFSPPAIKLAAGRGIQLIDDAQLALLIRKVFPKQ